MADDITPNQVSSAEYTAGIQLKFFPSLGVFGPSFNYNTFLASNRRIG